MSDKQPCLQQAVNPTVFFDGSIASMTNLLKDMLIMIKASKGQ